MPVGGLSRAWQIISRVGSFNRRILFRRGSILIVTERDRSSSLVSTR